MTLAAAATDEELVQAAARGDQAAFARLVERHAGRLTALAMRIAGDRTTAEDVVQETFVRAWTRAPAWRPGPAPYVAWLTRVATNLAIDHRRRIVPLRLDETIDPPDPAPDQASQLAADQRGAALAKAVADLPPRQRAAVALTYDLELSNAAAAEAMEISVGALELLLVRARKALRAHLRDWSDTHDA